MIGKSGTRDFHGSFSYFKRHEQFNANDFFNNQKGLPIARYRYNMYSYTVGGPVYIPKVWNREKNKLFFFWSQEFWPQQVAVPVTNVLMPTALERNGDFSQSFDTNGKLIVVKDPNTGLPFPGNIVPANRIDPNGQAILNFFPQPNFANPAITKGQYNYVAQPTLDKPQRLQTLKIDYNPTSNDLVYVPGRASRIRRPVPWDWPRPTRIGPKSFEPSALRATSFPATIRRYFPRPW